MYKCRIFPGKAGGKFPIKMLIPVSHSLSRPPETTMARGQKYQRGRIRHNIKHSGYFSCHSLSRCASCYRSEFWTISRLFLLLLIKFHPKARFFSYFAPASDRFPFRVERAECERSLINVCAAYLENREEYR